MPDKIRCAHILVQKEALAKEILARIQKGESFAKLAEQFSIDSSRKRGGDIGFFKHGSTVKEFEKAAFNLQKNQLSGIVRTQFGYHIIKRLE
ncbi:MAG: peptidylprolyl isomerase [Thermoplasmataceae archaeon]